MDERSQRYFSGIWSRDHTYTLRVYALDNAPQLREGFWLNELLHAMEGHILGEAVAQLPARA